MFAVVVMLCGVAHADPEPAQPDKPVEPAQPDPATSLFEEGRALIDAHQPGPACEKFEAALKLEPDSLGTILNLGLCNEQLDKIATSLRWFRRVQARASELKKDDTEQAAKEKTSTLAKQVPTIAIAFSQPPPPNTTVTLDGVKVDEIDYKRVEVDAGTHELIASIAGRPDAHRTATVVDLDNLTITFPIETPPPPPPPRTEILDRGAHQRAQAYVLAGVGGGLLVADTVLALVAKSRFDDTDVLATRERWKNVARYGATSLFVAGSAAIGTAIYLYVKAPGKESVLVPAVSPEHLGLSLMGSF